MDSENGRLWVKCVNKISQIANKDAHSAFVAVSKSLQNKWSFIQWVVNVDENSYYLLSKLYAKTSCHKSVDMIFSEFDAEFMFWPSRFGIRNPMKTTISAFQTSLEASKVLQNSISLEFPFKIIDHHENSII